MNKKVRGIMSPGELTGQKVCNDSKPMKSVSIKPTKIINSVTGRGGSTGSGPKKIGRY